MTKQYAVIEEVCCRIPQATELMTEVGHYLEFESTDVPFSPLLRLDNKSRNHADYTITDRSTTHLKDVGTVQVKGYRTRPRSPRQARPRPS